jgi:ribosomal protein L24
MKNSTDEYAGHGGNVELGDYVKILVGDKEGQYGRVTMVIQQGLKRTLIVKLDQGKTITVPVHLVSLASSPN